MRIALTIRTPECGPTSEADRPDRSERPGRSQPIDVSMNTGVWSDGFSPFRAWRSMSAKVVFRASIRVTRMRSIRIPR